MDAFRYFEGGMLPSHYEGSGHTVILHTGFRCWLRYERVLEQCMDGAEKAVLCIETVVAEASAGTNMETILQAMSWFHSCGDNERLSRLDIPRNVMDSLRGRKSKNSHYWDFKALWDSFKNQHNIDLYTCEDMHWWDFRRLESDLEETTPYARLRALRGKEKEDFTGHDGKLDKKSKRDWDDIKKDQLFVALPEEDNGYISDYTDDDTA